MSYKNVSTDNLRSWLRQAEHQAEVWENDSNEQARRNNPDASTDSMNRCLEERRKADKIRMELDSR